MDNNKRLRDAYETAGYAFESGRIRAQKEAEAQEREQARKAELVKQREASRKRLMRHKAKRKIGALLISGYSTGVLGFLVVAYGCGILNRSQGQIWMVLGCVITTVSVICGISANRISKSDEIISIIRKKDLSFFRFFNLLMFIGIVSMIGYTVRL